MDFFTKLKYTNFNKEKVMRFFLHSFYFLSFSIHSP